MSEFLDLHALVDGDLSPSEAARVRDWVKSDPKAQAEFEAISNLKDFVVGHSLRYESEECWRACVVRLNEMDRSRKVEGFVGRYAWAMCLIFFGTIFVGHYAIRDVKGDTMRAAELGKILSVPGHSRSVVTPEQQREYDGVLKRYKQTRLGLRLERFTHSLMQDVPVDRFDLEDKSGPLAYFVINANVNFEDTTEDPNDPGLSFGVIGAPDVASRHVNCVIWSTGEATRVLAGPRSPQALESLASELGLREGTR